MRRRVANCARLCPQIEEASPTLPSVNEWLARQVIERGYVDRIVGCCRKEHQELTVEDTAICICNNCMAMIDEDADNGARENIWALIDRDSDLPLPGYEGMTLGIQDCGRAYDRADVHDAVRGLLRKMGINVTELLDAREKSHFCGQSFLMSAPKQDASFAPKRYVKDAKERAYSCLMMPRRCKGRFKSMRLRSMSIA